MEGGTLGTGMGLADSVERKARALMVSEVAALLNVSGRQIYKLAAERRIPYFKIAGSIRFDPSALALWLRQRMTHAGGSKKSTASRAHRNVLQSEARSMENTERNSNREDRSTFEELIEVLMAEPKSRCRLDSKLEMTVDVPDDTKEDNDSQEVI